MNIICDEFVYVYSGYLSCVPVWGDPRQAPVPPLCLHWQHQIYSSGVVSTIINIVTYDFTQTQFFSALNLNVTRFLHPINIFFYVHTFLFTSHIHTHRQLWSLTVHTLVVCSSVSFCSLSVPALLTFHQQRVLEIDFNLQYLFWSFSPTDSRCVCVGGRHAVLNDVTAAWFTLNPERRAPAGLH